MIVICSGCGKTVEEILDAVKVGEGMTFHSVEGKMYCEPCYDRLPEPDRKPSIHGSNSRIVLCERKENNTFDVMQTV